MPALRTWTQLASIYIPEEYAVYSGFFQHLSSNQGLNDLKQNNSCSVIMTVLQITRLNNFTS